MPPDSNVVEGKKEKLQKWLDQNQYSRKGILKYERIFGRTFVSVGGEHTTRLFAEKLKFVNNMKVLDIGCGIGGSAFYFARRFGVDVHGVDLSTNMIGIAKDYRTEMEPQVKHRCQFYVEDASGMEYPESFYDIVYSRDTILHIKDKLALFKKFYGTLKPGGQLLISDYCRGDQEHSTQFKEYMASRDYALTTVKEYGQLLEQAGFKNVEATDVTGLMVEMLQKELEKFKDMKERFIEEFSLEDYQEIKQGWEKKIVRCGKDGDQVIILNIIFL